MAQARDIRMPANEANPDTGSDTGLSATITLADGTIFDPPRAFENARKRLAHEQRKMARQFETRKRSGQQEYSNRLEKQIKVVAKLHTRVFNIRDYHHKKTAAVIAGKYRNVAIEEHGLQFMIRNRRLAKSAAERAIGNQKLLLKSKLGGRYVPVANHRPGIGGNSQTCLCGTATPKELKDRTHNCPACGLIGDRDVISANIAQLIAFGTTTIAARHPGRMSSDVETAKGEQAKAGSLSCRASERPEKRRSHASRRRRSTAGGKPTAKGKTGGHLPIPGVGT